MHTTDHDFLTKSNLIWLENELNVNTWMCFRKKFTFYKSTTPAIARIAVDSKYWLYVNGKLIVREGGLKRGPSPTSVYYDEVDLTEYLTDGTNHIALLVWYFGKSGFSHLSSGRGGLMFAMQNGDSLLLSDDTWKARKHPAFVEADPADPPTNFRLAESNLYFDAAKDIPNWYAPEVYDGILRILTTVENSSPYMEKYVLDALCEMGYIDAALTRIKRRYKDMVEEEYSTLWEFWDKSGTMNHAWSGGPLIILSKYLAKEGPMEAIRREKTAPHFDFRGRI